MGYKETHSSPIMNIYYINQFFKVAPTEFPNDRKNWVIGEILNFNFLTIVY